MNYKIHTVATLGKIFHSVNSRFTPRSLSFYLRLCSWTHRLGCSVGSIVSPVGNQLRRYGKLLAVREPELRSMVSRHQRELPVSGCDVLPPRPVFISPTRPSRPYQGPGFERGNERRFIAGQQYYNCLNSMCRTYLDEYYSRNDKYDNPIVMILGKSFGAP